MASSQQLAVGVNGTLSNLKSRWLKFNHDSGYQVQVSQNIIKPRARYFSVCYNAPRTGWKNAQCCRAHMKLLGGNQDEMTVTSLDLMHTCPVGTDATRRKRNYLTRDLADVSDVLSLYHPNQLELETPNSTLK